jgi:hypothetical protein
MLGSSVGLRSRMTAQARMSMRVSTTSMSACLAITSRSLTFIFFCVAWYANASCMHVCCLTSFAHFVHDYCTDIPNHSKLDWYCGLCAALHPHQRCEWSTRHYHIQFVIDVIQGGPRLIYSGPADTTQRANMTFWISYDEGETWNIKKSVCLTVVA